ncbi:hypothetical protein JHK86_047150 [Glycine max]|nr:hypothetical protein JHK86_047150 [Glycine max]
MQSKNGYILTLLLLLLYALSSSDSRENQYRLRHWEPKLICVKGYLCKYSCRRCWINDRYNIIAKKRSEAK